jgi:hypothetical protein
MFENIPPAIPYTIMALAVLALGYYIFREDLTMRFKGKTVEGKIVNWMATTEKGVKYFYPVIEYLPEGGELQRLRADDRCEDEPMYAVGTQVTVRHHPKDFRKIEVQYPEQTS